MKEIDLDGVLVAFIDFDDTAVVHLDHGKWDGWFKHCVCDSPTPYFKEGRTAPMLGMKSFLDTLRLKGISAFCLTVSETSIVVVPKEKVLQKYYGDNCVEKVISVGSRELKTKFIKDYCDEFCVPLKCVFVVDDHPDTLCECQACGCKVATPQEICCRYLETSSDNRSVLN